MENNGLRLYNLLEKAKSLKNTDHTFKTVHGWRAIIEFNDEQEFLLCYSKISQIPYDVLSNIEKYCNEQEKKIYQPYIQPIISALSVERFPLPWMDTLNMISDQTLNGIFMISKILEKSVFESIVESEKLNEWENTLNDLIVEIQNSTIDNNLKTLLTKEIAKLIFSIKIYQIHGSEGILGDFLSSYSRINFVNQNEKENPVFDKIKSVFSNIFVTLSVIANISQFSGYDIKNIKESLIHKNSISNEALQHIDGIIEI